MMGPAGKLVMAAILACAWASMLQAGTPLDRLGDYFSRGERAQSGKEEILDADRAFVMSAAASGSGTQEITVTWDIAEGYYLYRDKFRFSVDSGAIALGEVIMPPGAFITDLEFGKVEVYRHTLAIKLGLQRRTSTATTLTLNAVYQGCKEDTVCYPPISKSLPVVVPAITEDISRNAPATTAMTQPLSPADTINSDLRRNTLWLNLAVFLGFGLLLACTPCVFPMLPILSGIIVGHGHSLTTRRAFLLSLGYVLAMAMTYAVLGVIVAALQINLQAAAQNVWVIGIFSGIFVLLALSMFGFYELQLPTAWQGRLSDFGIRRQGSLAGVVLMGVMSAVIVGPCIAPPLAGALLYVSQTGNVVTGGAALFAMGMGMGLPLLVIGASAGRLLPRAGVWMETIKRIFGVIMLGMAIWFLERVVSPPVALFMWGSLATVTAIYMGAFDKLAPGATWHKLWKGSGIIMLVYGIAMIAGATQGHGDKFPPLRSPARVTGGYTHALAFNRVKTGADLDRALLEAARRKQIVMLDFYADWCVTCKEMENYTFSNSAVQEQLQNVMLLQADVTANDADDRALLQRFDIFGPPAILFFAEGRERRNLRVIGYMKPEDFIQHVRAAMSR
jgi:thiol:disulfide interchange protein DsbD